MSPSLIPDICATDPSLCYADPGYNIATTPAAQMTPGQLAAQQTAASASLATIASVPSWIWIGGAGILALLLLKGGRR